MLHPRGYLITSITIKGSMPICGVRNFTLNQYLGSVNYNMGKNSIFRVHKPEKREKGKKRKKERIDEFDAGLQTF